MNKLIFDIVLLVISLVFWIVLVVFIMYFSIKNKIHNSYHKGYSHARNDEINYYQTIRDLDKEFTDVMTIAKENVLELNVEFFTGLINFGNKVRKLKNKY